MHKELAPAKDSFLAAIGSLGHAAEVAHAEGWFHAECFDRDGNLLWSDTFPNVVTTVGKNLALDTYLAGAAYTVVGPFMGLISSTSFTNLATTISALVSYTTNIVTLTTAAPHGLLPGDTFAINTVAGTGANIAVLNNTWVATTGTTGSTLAFSIGCSGLTITTLTGGNVVTTSGTRIGDTMTSHANWLEAGNANAPTYTAPRKTAAWSAASAGAKALSTALVFGITGAGTVVGCFLVYGSGAVSTIDNTAGILYSGGVFTGGNKIVANGDTLNVSYTTSL